MSAAPEAFPPGKSNPTTDAVILGQRRIAEVRAITPQEAAENERALRDAANGVKPRRRRGPNRKTREALQAEYQRGYDAALESDHGPQMLGTVLVFIFGAVLGAALGAFLL